MTVGTPQPGRRHDDAHPRTVRQWLLSAIAAMTLLVLGSPSVSAAVMTEARPAAADDQDITWAVDPANEEGPDGRAWVELDLDPGSTVTEHLAVRNLSRQEVTFGLSAADGYFTDKGRFSMLTSSQTSVAAGTWIDLPDSVTVEAGGTGVVPFTLTVPTNATPGDHAAGVAATVRSVSGDGGAVAVESRVGFRVITRVSGEIVPALDVDVLSTGYEMNWNPIEPGAVTAEVELFNAGNVGLTVDGVVAVGGTTGVLGFLDGAPVVELLPGDRKTVTARVTDVWPMGPLGTDVRLRATAGTGETVPEIVVDRTVWAMPWSQLLVLLGVGLLVYAWRAQRAGKRRRLRRMLDQARDEGRAQATREVAESTS